MHRKANACFLALLVAAMVSMGFTAGSAVAAECDGLVKSLRGDYEVLQADGGLWRFMEKSTRLRPESMIGFQIDSKIQRFVTHLEILCHEGKTISSDMVKDIQNLIGNARTIGNKSPDRTPAKQLLELLKALNADLDSALEKHKL